MFKPAAIVDDPLTGELVAVETAVAPDRLAESRPIRELRARLLGRLVFPADPDWDEARQAWNLALDQRPFAVAVVACVEDIVELVRFARAHGLRIAPQATGHGASALPALGNTILLKTALLRDVEIDAAGRRARIGAGAVWADVIEPAADAGFVVLHGSAPDVGVVGYTLGGGLGWLARSRGLAASSVTAVELVTAAGELVRADCEHEADLFWAVRGGGGSFGVVTAIELELYPTPELYAGAMFWPVERAGEVLRGWREWVETVPDEVTSLGRILHFPPLPEIPEPMRGGSFVVVEAVFTGPESEGARLLAPLRELEPLQKTFAACPATALQHLHMDPPHPVPGVGDGMFLDDLPVEAIDAVVETGVPPLLTLELRHLGGALASSSASQGAAGSLAAGFALYTAGIAPTPELAAAVGEAVGRVKEALAPWESRRSYFNFSERPIEGERLYPPETYRRLRTIRDARDGGELFLSNHPIPPGRSIGRERITAHPFFAALPASEIDVLAAAMTEAVVASGTEVVTVDERGTALYLIEEGGAEILGSADVSAGTVGPGNTFGEIALLLTGERTATVVACTPMRLLTLSGLDFERIRADVPEFERSLRTRALVRAAR
jgi:hypothetical protein